MADENQRAPDFVREDAIQFVAERLARRREFGVTACCISAMRAISPLNGRAAPIYAVRFQPFAGGGHGILNFLWIMFLGRCQRFFVGEQQQRLRGGLQSPFLKSCCQQVGQAGGFQSETIRVTGKNKLRLHYGGL